MRSIIIDEEKLNQIATYLDPQPLMAELNAQAANQQDPWNPAMLGEKVYSPPGMFTQFMDPAAPQMPQPPAPETPGGAAPGAPGAPFSPQTMAALSGMMPKQQEPQFAPAGQLQGGVPVNIQIPDISKLVQIHLGQQAATQTPPSLSKLIGG